MEALISCQPDLLVRGWVQAFAIFWDRFSLKSLFRGILQEGYKIPFTQWPNFTSDYPTFLVRQYSEVLLDEVTTLSQKGAIEEVQDETSEDYLPVP